MQNDKNFIGGNRRRQGLNYISLQDQNQIIIDEMNQFVSILQTHFDFNDDIKAQIKWIITELWFGHYHEFWNGSTYECFTIAAMRVATDQYGSVLNCDPYCYYEYLFRPEDLKECMIKINECYENLIDILKIRNKIDVLENIERMDQLDTTDYYCW